MTEQSIADKPHALDGYCPPCSVNAGRAVYCRKPPENPHRLVPITATASQCSVCGDRDTGQHGIWQEECPGVRVRCARCASVKTNSDPLLCRYCGGAA